MCIIKTDLSTFGKRGKKKEDKIDLTFCVSSGRIEVMKHVFLVSSVMLCFLALLVGGWFLFRSVFNADHQVQNALETTSQIQTARIALSLNRFKEQDSFVFGSLTFEGVVDLRSLPAVAYDGTLTVRTRPGVTGESAIFLVRQVEGRTFLRVESAPSVLLDVLTLQGIQPDAWNELESPNNLFQLIGEPLAPKLADANVAQLLRTRIGEMTWMRQPQPTLTEIVNGRVTRIYTADLSVDALVTFVDEFGSLFNISKEPMHLSSEQQTAWQGTRANLWIDQRRHELRRVLLQRANGDDVDFSIKEINPEVTILLPSNKPVLPTPTDRILPADDALDLSLEEDTTETVEDSSKDVDEDGLTDAEETFYGTNPLLFDTDGDGYGDGEEVQNGYNPVGTGALFSFGIGG